MARGQHDHGKARPDQLGQDVQPVAVGQAEVEQGERGGLCLAHEQGLRRAVGLADAVAGFLEAAPQERADRAIVVDHQHAR
jgi:hypothetical protein